MDTDHARDRLAEEQARLAEIRSTFDGLNAESETESLGELSSSTSTRPTSAPRPSSARATCRSSSRSRPSWPTSSTRCAGSTTAPTARARRAASPSTTPASRWCRRPASASTTRPSPKARARRRPGPCRRRSRLVGAAGALTVAAGAGVASVALRDPERRHRLDRQVRVWRLTARRGVQWAVLKVRGRGASEEERARLEEQFAIRTAEDVAQVLGGMKGAIMKAGQMLSFIADGLPPGGAGGAGHPAGRRAADGAEPGRRASSGPSSAPTPSGSSSTGTRCRWRPRRSARCTAPSCPTAASWR